MGVVLLGRGLIAMLFILAGIAKLTGPAPFLAHMAQHGVPGVLLWAVAALEIGAGTAVLLGWRLRYSAGALALFCLATAFVFHLNLADHVERSTFFKDLAIGGGLMTLAVGG
jgi:putative oxidoreductase